MIFRVTENDERISSSTSKGNQKKWYSNGVWLKANQFGYEGMAEYLASLVLSCSTLSSEEYVFYTPCQIEEDSGRILDGCFSLDFLKPGYSEVRFYKNIVTRKEGSAKEKISDAIKCAKDIYDLDIEGYLRKVFTLDAIILNEDRHLNNLMFLHNDVTGRYEIAPIFDNGLSLLSDETAYPSIYLRHTVKSKPYSRDFIKQYAVLGAGFTVDTEKLLSILRKINHRAVTLLKQQIEDFPEVFI